GLLRTHRTLLHDFSPAVRALGTSLQTQDGGYLRNTIHEPKLTCEICSAPIQPEFRICMQCNRHRKSSRPLADRAGSLIYAVKGSQSYRTDRQSTRLNSSHGSLW